MLVLLVGCATPAERELSTVSSPYAMLQNGFDPLDPTKLSPAYQEVTSDGESAIRYLENKKKRPLNILSLSGGGQNGAFGAGLLVGWSENGDRPTFDIVGGVSTGALLATHALLGTPADDEILAEMYTSIGKQDIFRRRGVFNILSGSDSLGDTTPLRDMIAKYVTDETLERVAAAYEDGRALVIGTTNIDYAQTWMWNMSKIARDGELELYRDILLASASFPIVFPPVEIDGHLFVDGAARSNLVVVGMAGVTKPEPPPFGPGNIYLISNGKLAHPPQALQRVLGEVAATSIGVMMDQSMQSAVNRSFFGARFLGYNFNLIWIPEDVDVGSNPLAFEPDQMRAAFDAGRAMAGGAGMWLPTPANFGDIPAWAIGSIEDATSQ